MTNPMMSGALLINGQTLSARCIGGDVFSHIVTRGLGLALDYVEPNRFIPQGGVGTVISRALTLYASILENNSPSSKFVQCMSLLEFLAYPDRYCNFKKVKPILLRYLSQSKSDHEQLSKRLEQFTHLEDHLGTECGYRTRIVHLGDRLERILPAIDERNSLFKELDKYIHRIIDHMIDHANLDWHDYTIVRDAMGPFAKQAKSE